MRDTSPVIATSCLIGCPIARESKADIIVQPAEGPSLGVAPFIIRVLLLLCIYINFEVFLSLHKRTEKTMRLHPTPQKFNSPYINDILKPVTLKTHLWNVQMDFSLFEKLI